MSYISFKCVCGSWVANNESAQNRHEQTKKHRNYEPCWLCNEACTSTDYIDDGRVFCSLDCLNDDSQKCVLCESKDLTCRASNVCKDCSAGIPL